MIRRRLLGLAGVLAVAALCVSVGAAEKAKPTARAGCACCGASCSCPSCTCDAQGTDRKSAAGCACCGDACCTVKPTAQPAKSATEAAVVAVATQPAAKSCCETKGVAQPAATALGKRACDCCGDACTCGACSCDASAQAKAGSKSVAKGCCGCGTCGAGELKVPAQAVTR